MKKQFTILLFVSIIPMVTYASWWNPFTWFKKSEPIQITQQIKVPISSSSSIVQVKTNEDLIFCNGEYWSKCSDGQHLVCLANGSDAYCQDISKPIKVKTPISVTKTPKDTIMITKTPEVIIKSQTQDYSKKRMIPLLYLIKL